MPCGATQDGGVMVERSDRMWSTGEGNGKPLQCSCLENPMNGMKRQNDRILKEELPRSVGAQYATGDAETPLFWPPDAKSWLIWKDPNLGKDWRQEEKGMTEDVMVRWHHQLNGHGFGWTLGVGDGQGGLACCGSWGRKEHTTEQLNWTEID